jgi:hypothetical protein
MRGDTEPSAGEFKAFSRNLEGWGSAGNFQESGSWP